ncbi:serine protease [Verrucosispora sp. ts21]|uniref:S8 family serine peptidase n=1 Tax=Verrucosispora sp. ts21 TaxID=2069341 RepID=UPI000C885349|nr:S8 family serine peptidase [Verrucosispora sp. ts21]PMR61534.1 serine protease [Verrucosispora sp. ts21]
MANSTSRNRCRRLALPALLFALVIGVTGVPGSAAPAEPRDDGNGYFTADRTATLAGGADRRPGESRETGPQAAVDEAGTGLYIVELAEEPLTRYAGGVSGLARTRPEAGDPIDTTSAPSRAYRKHLDSQRTAVATAAGIQVSAVYTTAFNGFSARLTAQQVSTLRADKRVRAVTASQALGTRTPSTPAALATPPSGTPADADQPEATGAAGPPTKPGKPGPPTKPGKPGPPTKPGKPGPPVKPGPGTGAGMVIGVLDTGIWPESPSFAKRMAAPSTWRGTCQTGVAFVAEHCNGKIVGARYFADAWVAIRGSVPEGEMLSPRDMSGHGTHVASTAAGLPLSSVTIDGQRFGPVSGAAPDAQIAVYKVLWAGAGYDADIIAGIDAAIADGVQVLNLSIGTEFGDWEANTPIGVALLNASLAGVFVAASAGNTGIVSGAISNASPWVTTVGAAVTKLDEATIKLHDGTKLVGSSLDAMPGGGPRPMVFGEQAGSLNLGASYCDPGSLDPAKIKGKVVACAMYDIFGAAAEIKAKGGVAMVLFDPAGNYRINSIFNFPVISLPTAQQAGKLFNYLMRHPTTATASLHTGGDGSSVPGLPSVADFSSTGPNRVATGVLKPDLVAPGSNIIAAVAPPGNFGREYDAYSGTSMASPYVAGAAAILRATHPHWSPGAVASALRTTATDTVGTSSPLDQGSGLVDLARATDPGLVIEPTAAELIEFSETVEPDGSELNLPAISLREYDGTRPVRLTRTLTNVGKARETYRSSVSGLPGMKVTVSPASVTLAPGASASVTITLSRGSAPWDRYVTGSITWRGKAHSARIPVAARPWGITPRSYGDDGEEFGRITNGAFGFFQPGFTGPLAGRSTGYTPMRRASYSMPAGVVGGVFDPNATGVKKVDFTVPANTAGIIVQTDTTNPNTNLDLYLYKGDTLIHRSSGSWTSAEQAYKFMPEPGRYTAYVFAQIPGGPVVDFELRHAIISRNATYSDATLTLPSTSQRGESVFFTLEPNKPLAEGDVWAYTEYRVNGTPVPGNLVYTQQSFWP